MKSFMIVTRTNGGTVTRPLYIAIEGPIGVGKTTLVRRLRERLQSKLVLEVVEENPFLGGSGRSKPFWRRDGTRAGHARDG